jgi:hypothetical protein
MIELSRGTTLLAAAAVNVYTMTQGRFAASAAVLVGLIAAVSGKRATGRRGAVAALVLGSFSLLVGGLVVATAPGGLGTGNGLGGGVVAMVVGLIGIALGGMALARTRRAA